VGDIIGLVPYPICRVCGGILVHSLGSWCFRRYCYACGHFNPQFFFKQAFPSFSHIFTRSHLTRCLLSDWSSFLQRQDVLRLTLTKLKGASCNLISHQMALSCPALSSSDLASHFCIDRLGWAWLWHHDKTCGAQVGRPRSTTSRCLCSVKTGCSQSQQQACPQAHKYRQEAVLHLSM